MAILNHEKQEVVFKVVYCGPPMSGKTTSLQFVHSRVDPSQRGNLISRRASEDRTLFFEFLTPDAVIMNGYRTKFQLYTVPGRVSYSATRQLVLRGVDGIVFVADSSSEMLEENVRAFQAMEQNISTNGTTLDRIPLVLQYNKRDVSSAAPLEFLEQTLNRGPRRVTSFESAATQGHNVFPTLNALSQLIVHRFYQVVGAPSHSPGPMAEGPRERARTVAPESSEFYEEGPPSPGREASLACGPAS